MRVFQGEWGSEVTEVQPREGEVALRLLGIRHPGIYLVLQRREESVGRVIPSEDYLCDLLEAHASDVVIFLVSEVDYSDEDRHHLSAWVDVMLYPMGETR